MGQAKQRGNQTERIAQAKVRIGALKPEYIVCNNCETHIADIHAMDTRGMRGIDAAFAGVCPSCGQSTYAVRGDPDAMADFATAMDEVMGAEGKAGAQLIHQKPKEYMTNTSIQFLSFDESVEAAKKEPGIEFLGLQYVAPFTRLDGYMIHVDPDEPDYVNIQFEGGELFDVGGEEDFYDLDDVPAEAKSLFYVRNSDLANGKAQINGMVSEYVLQQVLPDLDEADTYGSEAAFIQAASTEFLSFWRQS
jgi:hypothetical protein